MAAKKENAQAGQMESNTRVRLNFKETSKGKFQIDVTAETPNLQDTLKLMEETMKGARALMKKLKMEEVSE